VSGVGLMAKTESPGTSIPFLQPGYKGIRSAEGFPKGQRLQRGAGEHPRVIDEPLRKLERVFGGVTSPVGEEGEIHEPGELLWVGDPVGDLTLDRYQLKVLCHFFKDEGHIDAADRDQDKGGGGAK